MVGRDQLELFEKIVRRLSDGVYGGYPGHADDECSTAAAKRVKPKITQLHQVVFAMIKGSGTYGQTVFDTMRSTRLCKDTVAPRFTELKKLGLIEKSGRKRLSPNGGECNVWVAIEGVDCER